MSEKHLKSIKFAGLGDTYILPTATSDLENDSGYITEDSVPTKLSQLANDAGYITDSVFHKEPINSVNIDTTYQHNYVVAISESGHGTYPSGVGDWFNVVNFCSDHFITQIAYTCSNASDAARKVRMFIRERYMNAGWSNWNQIYTASDTIDIAHGGTSATDGSSALYNLMVRQDLPSSSTTLGYGEYRLIGGSYSWYGLPDGAWGSLIRIPGWDGYNFELCTITAGGGEGLYYRNFMNGTWTRVALPSDVSSSGGSSGAVNYVLDKTSGTPTYFNFASDGMSTTDWVAAWDGYTLRAISPTALKNVLGVSSGGSGMSREFNSGAINTTSYSYAGNQSKIYTVTTYHSESGTRHTFVFDYMAVAANGNKLRLSNYTAYGNISVLMGIQGSSVGFETTNCTLTNVCGYY